jgi:hypothetical protein
MIPPKDKTVPDSAEVGARKPLVRPQRGKSVGQVLVPGSPIKRLRVIPGLRSHVREGFLGSCHMFASERSG